MRAFFGILFIAASLFGYEINHENWAKFYKFSGDANGVKFEVYMNYFKDEIYYTKEIDFFLSKKKLAIICVPFSAPEIVFLKFKKLHASLKELGVSKLQIISVANQAEQSIEGIKCEILPFSRWSLG